MPIEESAQTSIQIYSTWDLHTVTLYWIYKLASMWFLSSLKATHIYFNDLRSFSRNELYLIRKKIKTTTEMKLTTRTLACDATIDFDFSFAHQTSLWRMIDTLSWHLECWLQMRTTSMFEDDSLLISDILPQVFMKSLSLEIRVLLFSNCSDICWDVLSNFRALWSL